MYFIEKKCAQNEIRTRTPVTALPPQSSVSTNSTIWALLVNIGESMKRKRAKHVLLSPMYNISRTIRT